jgi:hypothetical protein
VDRVLIFGGLALAGVLLFVVWLLVAARLERIRPGITRRPRLLFGAALLPPVAVVCLVLGLWVPAAAFGIAGALGWVALLRAE